MPGTPTLPICPKCSVRMELVRKAPLKDYDDIEDRTYECQKCGHAESWVVKKL
jgi:hypothetical protein